MRLGLLRAVIACCCWVALSTAKYIVPGARWHDTDGNLISAHAGSVSFDDATGRFWWFGEYKVEGQTEGGGVSVYSSEDLATWSYHGLALGESFRARPPSLVVKGVCRN